MLVWQSVLYIGSILQTLSSSQIKPHFNWLHSLIHCVAPVSIHNSVFSKLFWFVLWLKDQHFNSLLWSCVFHRSLSSHLYLHNIKSYWIFAYNIKTRKRLELQLSTFPDVLWKLLAVFTGWTFPAQLQLSQLKKKKNSLQCCVVLRTRVFGFLKVLCSGICFSSPVTVMLIISPLFCLLIRHMLLGSCFPSPLLNISCHWECIYSRRFPVPHHLPTVKT